jgi:hypothetical protein
MSNNVNNENLEDDTNIFDENTKEQQVAEEYIMEKLKEEEARKEKYKNMTLQDVENAIELLEYFVEQSEKAQKVLKRLKSISPETNKSPQQLYLEKMLSKMGMM